MLSALFYELTVLFHKKEFWISLLIMLAASIWALVSAFSFMHSQGMNTDLVSWSPDAMFMLSDVNPIWPEIKYIAAFALVLPFCLSFLNDRDCGVLPIAIGRCGKRHYFYSKSIACFLGSFLVILIPCLINLLLCHIAFPESGRTGFGSYGELNYYSFALGTTSSIPMKYHGFPFLRLFFASPVLYSLWSCFRLAFTCGMFGLLLLSISYLLPWARYLLFLPVFVLFRVSDTLNKYLLQKTFATGDVYINHSLGDYLAVYSYGGQSPWFLPILYGFILIVFLAAAGLAIHSDRIILGGVSRRPSAKKASD